MHPFVQAARSSFESAANPVKAAGMSRYMLDQFAYLGIQTPQRRVLTSALFKARGLPPVAELPSISRELWALPAREYQYLAVDLLHKQERKLPEEFTPLFEELLVVKSWWDSVDAIAAHSVGAHFQRYPQARMAWVTRWRAAQNLWLRRTTLLFQLHYKEHTDAALLFDLCRENAASSEFFLQKAIGWALREYAKTDAPAVQAFCAAAPLAALSRREALRRLDKEDTGLEEV